MAGSYVYKSEQDKLRYISDDVFNALVVRDILNKYKIRNKAVFDTLIDFVKTAKLPFVKKEGVLSDAQLEAGMTEKKAMAIINKAKKTGNWKEVEKEGLMNFKRDTMWVAVTDTIYGAGFNADSMRYVPFGNGAQFEMAIRNDTTKSGAPLHLFQAQTPYETYLSGLNAQELANLKDLQSKLGKYCGLRVGDIEQPNNNAGNWE